MSTLLSKEEILAKYMQGNKNVYLGLLKKGKHVLSCNIGKSTKNLGGAFRFVYVTAYLHVFIQQLSYYTAEQCFPIRVA